MQHLLRRVSTGLVTLAAVLAIASSASGQFNPRLSFTGGGTFLQGNRSFTANGLTFQTQFANGGEAAVRATIDLVGPWALEGSYGLGTNNLRVSQSSEQRDFGTRVHKVQFNVLRFFNGGPVRVFATSGVGLGLFLPTAAAKAAAQEQFTTGSAQLKNSYSPDFNLGGGIEARLSHRFGLRLDVRGHATLIPNFGQSSTYSGSSSTTSYYPVKGVLANIESTTGLVVYF